MLVKVIQFVLVALCFVIPLVGNLIVDSNTVFKNENRTAFAYPTEYVKSYWDDLQKALNDRLLGRESTQVITANYLSQIMTQTTNFLYQDAFSFPGNAVGWYFLGDRGDKHYQKHVFKLDKKDQFYEDNLLFVRQLETITPNTYVIVGPDKASIYPEYMNQHIGYPGIYRHFNATKENLLKENVKLVDNQEAIVAAKDKTYKTSLYLANDTHWNSKGALVAFNNTMKTVLGDKYYPIEYTFSWAKNPIGDLNKSSFISEFKEILDLAENNIKEESDCTSKDMESGKEVTKTRTFATYDMFQCNIDRLSCDVETIYNPKGKSDLKVVLISDSYGISYEPYVVDYFKNTMWCSAYATHDKVLKYIKEYKPDIILYLRIERFI